MQDGKISKPGKKPEKLSLGELEAQILDVVWGLEPPVTTAQVFKVIYARRESSYPTIMLAMVNLAKKGFLHQQRTGDKKTDAFVYTPTMTRAELGLRLMDEVSRKILRKPLGEALAVLFPSLSNADVTSITRALES